jgi:large subunit ribosomal protein L25
MTTDNIVLNAEKRTEFGKGPAHRLRAEAKVPAVVYGHGKEALPLIMDAVEVKSAIHHSGLLSISIKGNKKDLTAIIKDYQVHIPRGDVIHVDFQEVKADEVISVTVPLEAHGTPVGQGEGGQLEQIVHELDISVPANKIPEVIEVDVSKLDIDTVITVADLNLPESVETDIDPEQVVFTCRVPQTEEPEEGAEGAELEGAEGKEGAAEPEVISKGKQEDEEAAE